MPEEDPPLGEIPPNVQASMDANGAPFDNTQAGGKENIPPRQNQKPDLNKGRKM